MNRRSTLSLAVFLAALAASPLLAAIDMDSKYFSRNTRYMLLKGKLVLVERDRPGMVTMDEWPQLVFLSADGEHTVGEFIAALGNQYPNGAPQGFAEQIRQIVEHLAKGGYVTMHSGRQKLPYYLAIPVEEQDKERAKSLMETDGFIKKPSK